MLIRVERLRKKLQDQKYFIIYRNTPHAIRNRIGMFKIS